MQVPHTTDIDGLLIPAAALKGREKKVVKFDDGIVWVLSNIPPPWRLKYIRAFGGQRAITVVAATEELGFSSNGKDFIEQKEISITIGRPGDNVYEEEFRRYQDLTVDRGPVTTDLAELGNDYLRYQRGSDVTFISKDAMTGGICSGVSIREGLPNPFCRAIHFDQKTGDVVALTYPVASASGTTKLMKLADQISLAIRPHSK